MPVAYEGNQPYIFVSYSHRDTQFVHRVITHLQNAGCRVWFDGGIEAGSEWPEYIASHLRGSACVLTFISDTFVESQNCRRELVFAQELKKPLLNVYIEDVELTDGMRMQLGLSQAIFRSNYGDDESFFAALDRAKVLQDCKVGAPAAEAAPAVQIRPAAEKHTVSAKASKEKDTQPMDGKEKLIAWITALVELSYCLIGPWVMNMLTDGSESGWKIFGVMLIPHILVAVLNLLIMKAGAKWIHPGQRENISLILLVCCVVATLLAVVVGVFYIGLDINGFVKLLMSLGLNLIPAVVAGCCYFGSIAFGASKE